MVVVEYLRIFLRWWWVVALVTVTSVGSTVVFVSQQPEVYASEGTIVIRPRAIDQEDALRAFDTLIRGAEINATYAAIATSEVVRDRAAARLGDPSAARDVDVSTEIVTGTNILRLTAESHDPDLAHDMAVALTNEITTYVEGNGEAYLLAPLDLPDRPTTPVSPKRELTIALGAFLGLGAGCGMALVAEELLSHRRSRKRRAAGPGATELRAAVRRHQDSLAMPEQRLALATLAVRAGDSPDDPTRKLAESLADRLRSRLRAQVQVELLDDETVVVVMPQPGLQGLRAELDALREELPQTGDGRGPSRHELSSSVCVASRNGVRGDHPARDVLEGLSGLRRDVPRTPPRPEAITNGKHT